MRCNFIRPALTSICTCTSLRRTRSGAIFSEKSSLLLGSLRWTAAQEDILPITTNVIYTELLTLINISKLGEHTND